MKSAARVVLAGFGGALLLAGGCGGDAVREQRALKVQHAARLPLRMTLWQEWEQRVRGSIRADAQFDFVVGLYEHGQLRCAGALLQGGWVLTAAHCACVDTAVPGIDQRRGPRGGIVIDRWYPHHACDGGSRGHDIALLKLRRVPSGPWLFRAEKRDWMGERDPQLNVVTWGGCDASRGAACRAAVSRLLEGDCGLPAAGGGSGGAGGEGTPAVDAGDGSTFCTAAVTADSPAIAGGLVVAATSRGARLVGVQVGRGAGGMSLSADVAAYSEWIDAIEHPGQSGGVAAGRDSGAEREVRAE